MRLVFAFGSSRSRLNVLLGPRWGWHNCGGYGEAAM
jgi:hypothetical protein